MENGELKRRAHTKYIWTWQGKICKSVPWYFRQFGTQASEGGVCAKARFQCRLMENRACTDSRWFASDRSVQHTHTHTQGENKPCGSEKEKVLRLHICTYDSWIITITISYDDDECGRSRGLFSLSCHHAKQERILLFIPLVRNLMRFKVDLDQYKVSWDDRVPATRRRGWRPGSALSSSCELVLGLASLHERSPSWLKVFHKRVLQSRER